MAHKQEADEAARLNITGLKALFSISTAAYLNTNCFSFELLQSPSWLYSQSVSLHLYILYPYLFSF